MAYRIGMIGLGTMGRNLLLNMADHGFAVAGYDKDQTKIDLLESEGKGLNVKGFASLQDFIKSLELPRVLILLVPAGKIVDSVIEELIPVLQKGDIIIDGGNSHFKDTTTRVNYLQPKGLHFFGMGISGGEEGARRGPSMMPGGDFEAYKYVQPVLEAIAAKVDGEPCVTYIGPGASGHFVKMVHNGIEYALMQLIADTYEILKKGFGYDNNSLHQLFSDWNDGKLQSYLLSITADIFNFKEPGSDHWLVDFIRDEAQAKGTGKWTSQVAMDIELPVPTIDIAVGMRDLSKYKLLRTNIAALYKGTGPAPGDGDKEEFVMKLEDAFYFSMIIIYSQGMQLLARGSAVYEFKLQPDQIAKIWRGGCIIRAKFLELIHGAYQKDSALPHLIFDSEIKSIINESLLSARTVAAQCVMAGISVPAYTSTLSYFDALRSERMPSNLIQAQRDYFGAHTYQLIGKEGIFHTEWNAVKE
jgi:6-phosphogluconate dehydrogenase